MKIIYIMGYGRSGSTLLDIILGDNEEIVTTGALDNYHVWIDKNLKCACGKNMKSCFYWRKVSKDIDFSEEDINLVKKMDSIRSLFLLKSRKNVKRYCQLTKILFDSIITNFEKNIIVDSSKTARDCIYRPVMLSKFCNIELKPVFLIRDPRGVVWSSMKKHGSPEREKRDIELTRFLRALISWNLTNFMTLVISKVFLKRCLFIKYEDFCKDPINTLLSIKNFADIDVDNVINKISQGHSVDIGHNIGGNRLRFSKSIDSVQLDESWKSNMPKLYCRIVKVVSYPLIKYFKY